jgi:CHAD domain-containing protein
LLQRAALAELDRALKRLQAPTRTDIHEARKSCKKLRAWLRLLHAADARNVDATLLLVRDAARALAGRRDAAVIPQTLQRLRRSRVLATAQWRLLETRLRHSLRKRAAVSGTAGDKDARARDLLRGARGLVVQWQFETMPAWQVADELRRDYRRTRKTFLEAQQRPRSELLHELRKRAKFHAHQCALLSKRWSALDGPRERQLSELAEVLGQHHDLEVLRLALLNLPRRGGTSSLVTRTLPIVENWQARLAKRALQAAGELFKSKPSVWPGVDLS